LVKTKIILEFTLRLLKYQTDKEIFSITLSVLQDRHCITQYQNYFRDGWHEAGVLECFRVIGRTSKTCNLL